MKTRAKLSRTVRQTKVKRRSQSKSRGSPRTASRPALPLSIKSILVPTDFSPASEKALAYAVPLARLWGARLTIVNVVEPIATPDFAMAFPLALEEDRLNAETKRHLRRMVDHLKIEPKIVEKLLVRNGRAFNEIVSAARTLKADLIIISTHGRTGLKHALLGSTAERVVQHAPCPVLVVRPHEREFLKH